MPTKTPKTPHLVAASPRSQAAFHKLSPAEKRVAIAKDALLQLRSEALIARCGTYVYPSGIKYPAPSQELSEQLPNLGQCYVCARGALFLSAVRKGNNFKTGSFIGEPTQVLKPLEKRYWSRPQIKKIEAAFEGFAGFKSKTCKFFDKYDNAHDRLVAILKNIIKNNGTFIP